MFVLQKTYLPFKKRSMAMPLSLINSLLLIFFVIAVWLLNAQSSSHAGGNISADVNLNKLYLTQEAGRGKKAVAASAARDNRPKARKMMVDNLVKKEKMTMMLEKRNVAAASEKSGSSKMSTRVKLARKEVDWSEEGQKRSLLSKEINVGFVAFNADYHGPRHHPPKNN